MRGLGTGERLATPQCTCTEETEVPIKKSLLFRAQQQQQKTKMAKELMKCVNERRRSGIKDGGGGFGCELSILI